MAKQIPVSAVPAGGKAFALTPGGTIPQRLVGEQRLPVGAAFTLYNSAGAPILRVTEAGTFHILTGASWTADL